MLSGLQFLSAAKKSGKTRLPAKFDEHKNLTSLQWICAPVVVHRKMGNLLEDALLNPTQHAG